MVGMWLAVVCSSVCHSRKGCMAECSHTRSVAIRSHTMSSNATARVLSIRDVFSANLGFVVLYKLHCERRLSTKNYEWSLSR